MSGAESDKPLWRRVGLWRLGVALYIGALCALLGAYMSVSLREVQDAVRLDGGELIVGQPNMLRGELTQVRTSLIRATAEIQNNPHVRRLLAGHRLREDEWRTMCRQENFQTCTC